MARSFGFDSVLDVFSPIATNTSAPPLMSTDVAVEIQGLRRSVENVESMLRAHLSSTSMPADEQPQIGDVYSFGLRMQDDMQRTRANLPAPPTSVDVHTHMEDPERLEDLRDLRSEVQFIKKAAQETSADVHSQMQELRSELQIIKSAAQDMRAAVGTVTSQIQSSEEAQMSMIQQQQQHVLTQQKDVLDSIGQIDSQVAQVRAGVRSISTPKASWTRPSSSHLLSRSSTTISSSSSKMPDNAFVINFRRFIWMTAFLSLVHELIKSTAIAALTLVAAASLKQMACSCTFILLVFIIYARHEMMHDCMDIGDVKSLVPLMAEDESFGSGSGTTKLFRSLSLHSRWSLTFIGGAVGFIIIGVSFLGWLCQSGARAALATEGSGTSLDSLQSWSLTLVDDDDDLGSMAMQLIILDIMFALECIFEYILWRETASVFSPDARHRCWLLGLPSLWYTKQDVLRDLKAGVVKAQMGPDRKGCEMDIYPHELACYALQSDEERLDMSKALEDLGTTLVFYDNQLDKLQTVQDHAREGGEADHAREGSEADHACEGSEAVAEV